MKRYRLSAFLLVATAVACAADVPRLVNAKLVTRSASAGLQKEVTQVLKESGPAWIAYSVAGVPGEHNMCCYTSRDGESGCNGCYLENEHGGAVVADKTGPVKLEGGSDLLVFLRANQGRIEQVRAFSADCPIDASGLSVYWLTDVRPSESVALLASLLDTSPSTDTDHSTAEGAIAAIAFHADPAADATLDRLVALDQPRRLRKQAAFWLGQARGDHGLQTLVNLMHHDPSDDLRAEFTFPLSQSKRSGAQEELIRVAREDRSAHVRGQALFWLAQKAGKKVQGVLSDAVANDPDADVKKKAVFAISQMPPDQGVPLLIQLAKTNRNPAVRKQAVFWLGQSHDPRALDFITEVLTK